MGSTVSVILGLVLAVLVLVLFTVKLKIHPFFALIATSATFAIVAGMNMQDMLSAFTSGMGGTISDIGLVIALGTVTGTLLEKSGAAETRRLSKDTKISMTTMAISLAMGLHATHMFVPPTPGPLAVAGILNADLGMVILFGALVSIPVMLVGYFASLTAGKKYYYIPEDDSDVTEEEDENAKLPSALASFMPILVPILLMLLKTVGDMVASENILLSILNVIGTPAVALLIGMLLAAYTYHNIHPEDKLAWSFDGLVADSLRTAGQIVLIVGAGGAFGGVLKASAMQSVLTDAFSGLTIGILAPFLIGFIFRTCVGSATIAMVTAATMITPLIDVLGFSSPMGRVIAMLACAAGGMMVFHGNDDFFWVTTTTSKMDTSVAYKTIPIISVLQSLTALVVVFVLSLIFLH